MCLTTPNFLTYSMGGIILRVIKSMHPDFAVARVVRPIMDQKLLINGGLETVRASEWTRGGASWSRCDSQGTSQR